MEEVRKESMEVRNEYEHERLTKVTTKKLFIQKKTAFVSYRILFYRIARGEVTLKHRVGYFRVSLTGFLAEGAKQAMLLMYQMALMESGFMLTDPHDFTSKIYSSVKRAWVSALMPTWRRMT